MSKKKNPLPFDGRGGKLVFSRLMIQSPAFLDLSASAQALILHIQIHWRNAEPVSFGVREAAKILKCKPETACKFFRELVKNGFIECVDQSYFNSRTGSRPRKWRLTWLPFNSNPPTNEWEKCPQK